MSDSVKKRHNNHLFGAVIVFFLTVPFFFDEGGIFNSTSPSDRGIPISIMLISTVPLLVFTKHKRNGFFFFLFALICLITPFIIYELLFSYYFSAILIGIYVAPLVAGYSSSVLCREFVSELGLQKIMVRAATTLSVVSIAWLSFQIQNIITTGRADGSVWDIFVIYQVWVYWPTVLAIFFCFQTGYKGNLAKFNQVILAISILATGAREPILFCLTFYFLLFVFKRDFKNLKIFLYGIILSLALILIVYIYFPDSVIADKIGSQLTGEQDLSAGRLQVIEQFNWLNISPFIGTGFSDAGIFGSPHNQYLELFYRGGLLSILSLAIMSIILLFREGQSHITKVVLITLLLVSFNINTPLRSPYAGVIFWFLFFSHLKDTPKRQRDETNHSKHVLRAN